MFESFLESDTQLFLYLNNLGTTSWDGFWLLVTNKFSAIPLYLILIGLVYRSFGLKNTLLIVGGALLLVLFTDQTTNFFKYSVGRLRPCHEESLSGLFRLVKESCGGKYSYFSGHASNSMAITFYFGLLLKNRMKIILSLLIIWALLVSYSRIYVGVHYPLDVISGIIFGGSFGIVFYLIVNKLGWNSN